MWHEPHSSSCQTQDGHSLSLHGPDRLPNQTEISDSQSFSFAELEFTVFNLLGRNFIFVSPS